MFLLIQPGDAEEAEAKLLQKTRMANMHDEDFEESALQATRVSKPTSSKAKTSGAKGASGATSSARGIPLASAISSKFENTSKIEQLSKDYSQLTHSEKLELLLNESPELLGLLEEFKEKIKYVSEKLEPLMLRIRNDEIPTNKGISFLEMKYHLLLSYCSNISFYLLLKSKGESVKDHPVIEQLVKLRTILERIKPIEQKLKYQIDKLLKTATAGVVVSTTNDPLRAKPNLKNFAKQSNDAGANGADDANEEANVYKAPKRTAVFFENAKEKEKKKEALERARKASGPLLEFIREEYSEAPLEMRELSARDREIAEEDEQRRQFEEENFVRTMLTKKEMKKRTKDRRGNELQELTDFSERAAHRAKNNVTLFGEEKKKSSIAQTISEALEAGKKKVRGGDEDLPRKQERYAAAAYDEEVESHFGGGDRDDDERDEPEANADGPDASDSDSGDEAALDPDLLAPSDEEGDEGDEGEEDEYYKEAQQKKRARDQLRDDDRKRRRKEAFEAAPELGDGEKRQIGYVISKNKGIGRTKKSDISRVRLKKKFENAKKRRRGAVREMRSNDRPYAGEESAINPNVVHSRRLNK